MNAPYGKDLPERLKKACPGLSVRIFDETDSTNLEAKRAAVSGAEGPLLILAGSQTAGRGRLGRTFYSPADTGVYMTLLFPPRSVDPETVRVTAKTAVAVLRGIERVLPVKLRIKWVNDLYLDGRKIAGILAETVFSGPNAPSRTLVGIGINVSTADFPEEIRDRAGALTNDPACRGDIVLAVTEELLKEFEDPASAGYLDLYRSRSSVLGKEILYGTAPDLRPGRAVRIDDSGALIVRRPDGTEERLFTGEITVRTEEET